MHLGYAELGDPEGRPVLWFHGGAMAGAPAVGTCDVGALGVRLIGLDRTGSGGLLDWPGEVERCLDELGIERCAAMGTSAGGPYALACAVRLADRLTQVGVVAGVLPPRYYDDDEMTEPRARAYFEEMAADLDASVAAMATRPGPDGAVYGRPEVQAQFLAARREAFRTIGIDGLVHELLVLNRDWGFDLDDVVVPVRWWHGELDALTPGDLLRDVVGGRAGFRLTIYPGEGHTVGLTHTAEILAELALA